MSLSHFRRPFDVARHPTLEPEVKRAILVVSLTLILALSLTTFLLTRSITRPLNMLVGEAQRLARGDFRTPVRVATGTEEIRFLADEFDKMRARIAAFQERLIERLEESERRRIESERLAAIGTSCPALCALGARPARTASSGSPPPSLRARYTWPVAHSLSATSPPCASSASAPKGCPRLWRGWQGACRMSAVTGAGKSDWAIMPGSGHLPVALGAKSKLPITSGFAVVSGTPTLFSSPRT